MAAIPEKINGTVKKSSKNGKNKKILISVSPQCLAVALFLPK